ncbi:MAG: ABC transporter ATP-binding protein [Bdellovibrionales bacterium]|nr:ABC transporter ATP-binding protein [Bdellovibrionales bacterium]
MISIDDLVVINNVSKSYAEGDQNRLVLKLINLNIKNNEIVALTGNSGSGKSTLLNLVSGIDALDEGSIKIGNQEITSLSETERTMFRRKHLGFVFQFFNLVPYLSVWDNVLLPLAMNHIKNAANLERADSLLSTLGIRQRKFSYPYQLSGGEQQRVAIARALVHDPDLLLADEPTGNLDGKTANVVMDTFRQLILARGKSAIVVTHSREIASKCDRIFSIRDNSLFEQTQ